MTPRSQAALYPNGVQVQVTKPQGSDPTQTIQNTQAGQWVKMHCSIWHWGLLSKVLAPPGIGCGARGSGLSSCSDSPMSMGSPAITSSLALALKVCTRVPTPALLDTKKESSEEESSDEEDMDTADNSPRDDSLEDHSVHTASVPFLAHRWSVTTHLKTIVFRWPACLAWRTAVFLMCSFQI